MLLICVPGWGRAAPVEVGSPMERQGERRVNWGCSYFTGCFQGAHMRLALWRQGVWFWKEASSHDPGPPANCLGVWMQKIGNATPPGAACEAWAENCPLAGWSFRTLAKAHPPVRLTLLLWDKALQTSLISVSMCPSLSTSDFALGTQSFLTLSPLCGQGSAYPTPNTRGEL